MPGFLILKSCFRRIIARACRFFGYRAIGTIEQQIHSSSSLFPKASSHRFRCIAPLYFMEDHMADGVKLLEEKELCSVCLELFESWDRCFLAPCRHIFHMQCILKWIHISLEFSCPSCRQDMYSPDRKTYYARKTFFFLMDVCDFSFDSDLAHLSRMLAKRKSHKTVALIKGY